MSDFHTYISMEAYNLLSAQLEACKDELKKLERLKVCLLCVHAHIIDDIGWCGMRDEWGMTIYPEDTCHLSPSCWEEKGAEASK